MTKPLGQECFVVSLVFWRISALEGSFAVHEGLAAARPGVSPAWLDKAMAHTFLHFQRVDSDATRRVRSAANFAAAATAISRHPVGPTICFYNGPTVRPPAANVNYP